MGDSKRRSGEVERDGRGAGSARDASFRAHFGTYLLFGLFFFVLNLLTDPGNWWFYWPMFGWGIGVVAHAFATYGADAPARVTGLLHDWLGRMVPLPHAPPPPPVPPFPSRVPHLRPEPAARSRPDGTELERIVREGEAKVDAMRREARRIPKPDVRSQALDVCASADRILAVLAENPDDVRARQAVPVQLASDFLARYLTPAEAIVTRYTRLATRGVTTAEPTLSRVEQEDLPLLDRKFRELYDRLHRGDLIDLEVAREMLQLDFAAAGSRSPES